MSRDDDKPKRTWREIDAKKDRSAHRKEDKPVGSPFAQARADSASKVYRSKLDAFFEGDGKAPEVVRGKLEALTDTSPEGKKRTAALKLIKDAATSSQADGAVRAFLSEFELPLDYDILSQVLLCSDDDYVGAALHLLEAMMNEKRVPSRVALLEQRLKRVKSLSEVSEQQKAADRLIKQLRLFS
ncbi:MAG: hypothetical protein MUC50_06805 [Myxococcota bacterium]|jgi:hypothetical protein|nr:hypothetical protein [Myxococcota bacterium]